MTDEEGERNTPGRREASPRDDGASPDGSETATGTVSDATRDGPERDGSGPRSRPDDSSDEATAARDRRPSDRRPRPQPGTRAADRDASFLTRFRTARSGPLLFIRETLYSALAVVAVGLLLFAISGVWPPMVAVESGSMEPEMSRGDLIFVTEPQRFTPDYAYGDTGVVTVDIGSEEGYRSFGGNGSVVIYDPPSRAGSPIIHRAHFHVEEGENWYDRANTDYMNANDCSQLSNCPAPHDGFITKGDANARYDQASNIAGPVRPEWIRGTARIRIPYLGYVRLKLAGALAA
ncbi:S26 family signal peptidase [Halobellus litoreus]|uniref:S26 family signal peptidase n=1 Tax=Halobellus litoreus TaxID=755310 RepID=A0ABD6DU45_9EURY|nr:S26 family signal peptidase [Halobellus litoreus]